MHQVLCNRDQSFTALNSSLPQFVEAWKGIIFIEYGFTPLADEPVYIVFLASEDMHEGRSDTAKCPFHSGVELRVGEALAGVEQAQVCPEIKLEEVDQLGVHGTV